MLLEICYLQPWHQTFVSTKNFDLVMAMAVRPFLDPRFAEDILVCYHIYWRGPAFGRTWGVFPDWPRTEHQKKTKWWLQRLNRHHFCPPQLFWTSHVWIKNKAIHGLAACWISRHWSKNDTTLIIATCIEGIFVTGLCDRNVSIGK